MLLIFGIILAIILAIAAEGDQRIVHVSKLINDSILPYDEGDSNSTCCVYGNCSCNSLDAALASLTSNVLINIMTDVTLSSLIKVSDLENVSVVGYNNPTVNCRNIGGIHFTCCHDCIFNGITWNGCGSNYNNNNTSKLEAGLKLSYSCNIMIQNCLFQHSLGPVMALLVSKNVKISNCRFLYNQDVFLYVINQNLYFNGNILFQNNYNTMSKGDGGIYICNHSIVIFSENSNVEFVQNSAITSILSVRNNSSLLFKRNSTVMLDQNYALEFIIHSEIFSNIIFTASCNVTFNNNSVEYGGAIIHSVRKSHITFMGNSTVKFSNSRQYSVLGISIIFSFNYSHICFKGNSFTVFYNNTARAIISIFKGNISFEGNSTTEFVNNYAQEGAALNLFKSTSYFEDNSATKFSNNIATVSGGAIYCEFNSYIHFGKNSTTIFNNNTAYETGGAILLSDSYATFEGNSFTLLYDNTAMLHDGGAIYSKLDSHIIFGENSYTLFHKNMAGRRGGAILSKDRSVISFSGNSTVTFNKNEATFGATLYSFDNCKMVATGDFRVIINDVPVKWCTNGCMPYSQSNDALIDRNGRIWCNKQTAFTCKSKRCHCRKLEDILITKTRVLIAYITDTVIFSSPIYLKKLETISIIGHNRSTVICTNGSGVSLRNCKSSIIEGITWIGCGDFSTFKNQSVLSIYESNM